MAALRGQESRADLALDSATLDRYLAMYANADTLGASPDVRRAVDELYARGHAAGILQRAIRAEYAP